MVKWQRLITASTAFSVIKKDIDSGRLSHAYMIESGDSEVVDSFITLVAMTLYCESGNACGECIECRKIAENNNTNIFRLKGQDKSGNLKVEDVALMIESTYVKPLEDNYMIYAIERGEKMSPQAQNKLLKTLEEPVGNTLILIGTTNSYSMLDTVKSRCKKLTVGRFPIEDVVCELPQYGEDEVKRAYEITGGIASKIETLLTANRDLIAEYDGVRDVLKRLKSSKDVPSIVAEMGKVDQEYVNKFIDILEIVFAAALKDPLSGGEAGGISRMSIVNIENIINKSREKLHFNCRPQGVMDYLLLGILEVKFRCR